MLTDKADIHSNVKWDTFFCLDIYDTKVTVDILFL